MLVPKEHTVPAAMKSAGTSNWTVPCAAGASTESSETVGSAELQISAVPHWPGEWLSQSHPRSDARWVTSGCRGIHRVWGYVELLRSGGRKLRMSSLEVKLRVEPSGIEASC